MHCLAVGILSVGIVRGMHYYNNHSERVCRCVTMVECVHITYETQTCSWGKYGEMKDILDVSDTVWWELMWYRGID